MKTGHEVGGVILFVFFLVAAGSALAISNNCTNSAVVSNLTGALPCSDAVVAAVLAALLVVISIVLFATGGEPRPVPYSQVYFLPQAPPPAAPAQVAPPPPPMVACPGCRRVYQLGQFRHCPNCGGKLE